MSKKRRKHTEVEEIPDSIENAQAYPNQPQGEEEQGQIDETEQVQEEPQTNQEEQEQPQRDQEEEKFQSQDQLDQQQHYDNNCVEESYNKNYHDKQHRPRQNQNNKKYKPAFQRINFDPKKRYYQPEERESWGPNVKGKKFRKEKGKKKRCPNANIRIDGSVKSIRLDT